MKHNMDRGRMIYSNDFQRKVLNMPLPELFAILRGICIREVGLLNIKKDVTDRDVVTMDMYLDLHDITSLIDNIDDIDLKQTSSDIKLKKIRIDKFMRKIAKEVVQNYSLEEVLKQRVEEIKKDRGES